MKRMQTHAFRIFRKVEDTQRGHAVFGSTTRQSHPAAGIGATGAPTISADVVAALDKNARRVAVQYDVVTAHVSAERGGADRAWSAKAQMVIIRTDANQVGIAIRINLHAADEEDMIAPVLNAIKAMTGIAVRFRPAHHSPVPAKSRHWQAVEVGHVHARAQKDQFHVRPA